MRDLSEKQSHAVFSEATRPTFLVTLNFGDLQTFSTNGTISLGETTWVGEDASVQGLEDWSRAEIRLRPTPERVALALTQDWRGSEVHIELLPVVVYDDDDFWEDPAPADADRILLLDGVLTSAAVGETLDLTVVHRAFVGQWSPRIRIAKPWANHLPQPGTTFVWQGDVYTLEAR